MGKMPSQLAQAVWSAPGRQITGEPIEPGTVLERLAQELAAATRYSDMWEHFELLDGNPDDAGVCLKEGLRKHLSHFGAVPRRRSTWGATEKPMKQHMVLTQDPSYYRDPGNWSYCLTFELIRRTHQMLLGTGFVDAVRYNKIPNYHQKVERAGDLCEALLGTIHSEKPRENWDRRPWDIRMTSTEERPHDCAISRFLLIFHATEDAEALLVLDNNVFKASDQLFDLVKNRIMHIEDNFETDTRKRLGRRSEAGQDKMRARDAARAAARNAKRKAQRRGGTAPEGAGAAAASSSGAAAASSGGSQGGTAPEGAGAAAASSSGGHGGTAPEGAGAAASRWADIKEESEDDWD